MNECLTNRVTDNWANSLIERGVCVLKVNCWFTPFMMRLTDWLAGWLDAWLTNSTNYDWLSGVWLWMYWSDFSLSCPFPSSFSMSNFIPKDFLTQKIINYLLRCWIISEISVSLCVTWNEINDLLFFRFYAFHFIH